MRQSELYTKTLRSAPKDEESKNARLLIRGGFVHKEMAGVYSYLPLGMRVLRKVEQIIREEMENIGGREVLLTTLQDPRIWEKTNRWSDKQVDIWFKTQDNKYGFAWSHEEPIANMMKQHISSYADLPIYLYQFQKKLRNEPRARSGLLRGREFIMKDLYSFSETEEDLDAFYHSCMEAYQHIFRRVGIGDVTYLTFASGGAFTEFSHEFQTISPAGEDTIYVDKQKKLAVNKEVMSEKVLKELELKKADLIEERSIEVGNIFKFGTQKSEQLGLKYKNKRGKEQYVVLGSYGIGLDRLIATIVEIFADERGIVWPPAVAPFQVHLLELEKGQGSKLYRQLEAAGIEVLYDERDLSPGEKFKDADLIGIPLRLVVSKKTGHKVEVKERTSEDTKLLEYGKLIQQLS